MAEPEPDLRAALPAPYESPWRLLAQNLRAVLASLRLSARALWRRNREGDLPRPSFWPTSLATFFWPLLAVLSVASLLVISAAVARMSILSAPGNLSAKAISPPVSETPVASPVASVPPDRSNAPAPPGAPEKFLESKEPVAAAEPEEPPPPAAPALTPLQELAIDDPLALLAEARPEPAAGRLVLVLTTGWRELDPDQRQRQAERWQQQVRDRGYESLLLQDGDARLLARSARVGSGMILLASPPPADVRGS